VNTEEDLQAYISIAFDEVKIKKDLAAVAVNTFLLVLHENSVAGYAKLRTDRTRDEFKGELAMELERIYVLKKFQDLKAGKALMDECLRLARLGGFQWFWLGVNKENFKAINFYKRYGMEVFGTKPSSLEPPWMRTT
jgi:ribosomal protein S18 acetylase RimI-like enzyme